MRSLLHDYLATDGNLSYRLGQAPSGSNNIFRDQRDRSKVEHFPLLPPFLGFPNTSFHLSSARSVVCVAEVVPKTKGDYPCAVHRPHIREHSKGPVNGVSMEGRVF